MKCGKKKKINEKMEKENIIKEQRNLKKKEKNNRIYSHSRRYTYVCTGVHLSIFLPSLCVMKIGVPKIPI